MSKLIKKQKEYWRSTGEEMNWRYYWKVFLLWLKRMAKFSPKVLKVIIPLVAFYIGRVTEICVKDSVIWILFAMVAVKVADEIVLSINTKAVFSGIIVKKKRFTEEQENGMVSINEDEMEEAIVYLYELENYFERIGVTYK